jgi:hypothetical protein
VTGYRVSKIILQKAHVYCVAAFLRRRYIRFSYELSAPETGFIAVW